MLSSLGEEGINSPEAMSCSCCYVHLMSDLPIRNPRYVRSVIGCALRRQLSEPGSSAIVVVVFVLVLEAS